MVIKKGKILTMAGVSAAAAAGCRILREYRSWHPSAPKPAEGKKRIVCVGDSITFGAGVKHPAKDAWPMRLQQMIGNEYQVMNFGLSGRTLLAGGDMPYTREKFYPMTFQAKPYCCLCMLGTNDSKPYNWDEADYKKELETFLQKYCAVVKQGHVFVMKPPKAFVVNGQSEVMYNIRDEVIQKELEIIDEIAEKIGIPVIDLYHFTQNHPEWFPDGVHPNEDGNRYIAEYIAGFVTDRSEPDRRV
ncbi:MAG: GDSL-type esterase/lipase family protein [Lachnospiraceae bacterium]|nr:GDSL-type esterase/lipase family protein [Lachnospiraceae bacterium]